MTRMELKTKAKESLKGNWGNAIVAILIFGLIISAVGGIISGICAGMGMQVENYSSLESIAVAVVNAFLIFGLNSFFLKISRNETVTFQEVFSKTNMFIPALLISILSSVFIILWSILFIIPGIIAAISYSQVMYLVLDNPDLSAMDAIKKSKEIMNGHKLDWLILQLSFIGWAILATIPLGIGWFWLTPYIEVTNANFYNSIKG